MGIRAALAVHSTHGQLATAVADRLRPVVDHLDVAEAGTVDQARTLMAKARDRFSCHPLDTIGN